MAISVRDALSFLRRNRPSVVGQVARFLGSAVARRTPISEIAHVVGRYFDPALATRRNAAGQLVRTTIGVGSWPMAPGQATQHHRLVMLTETSRAHSNALVRDAGNRGRFVRWVLSSAHPAADACDEHASRDTGFGRGVYRPSDFPPMPQHPRCRCFVVVVPLGDIRG